MGVIPQPAVSRAEGERLAAPPCSIHRGEELGFERLAHGAKLEHERRTVSSSRACSTQFSQEQCFECSVPFETVKVNNDVNRRVCEPKHRIEEFAQARFIRVGAKYVVDAQVSIELDHRHVVDTVCERLERRVVRGIVAAEVAACALGAVAGGRLARRIEPLQLAVPRVKRLAGKLLERCLRHGGHARGAYAENACCHVVTPAARKRLEDLTQVRVAYH
mmetsp:Transcript_26028/g.67458  ORF Transcript_26028/g.67458 Transcript_26028/m.67458 type:complete len:219 (+) Transcript_26028:1070-1726(+)